MAHHLMVLNFNPGIVQTLLPVRSGADSFGIVQESEEFLLVGELGEGFVVGIVGGDEGFFAMEDGGIFGGLVVAIADLSGAELDLDTGVEFGMGIEVEFWVKEVGDFGEFVTEFDQGGVVEVTEAIAGTGFVEAQERGEGGNGTVVNVKRPREFFTDGASLAILGNGKGGKGISEGSPSDAIGCVEIDGKSGICCQGDRFIEGAIGRGFDWTGNGDRH